MRFCRYIRIMLRPTIPKHIFSDNISSSSHILGHEFKVDKYDKKTRLHGNYRLLTPARTLRSLERRFLMVLTVTGVCLLMSILCLGIWINTGWELISRKECHNSPQDVALNATAQIFVITTAGELPQWDSESIHLAIIVGGGIAVRQTPLLVKSIFYRHMSEGTGSSHNYQLHVICDGKACISLKALFETWRISRLKTHFYNASAYLNQVNWIPTIHYSGIYGLLKLVIPDILPKHLNTVIALDMDTLINNDLKELKNYVNKFSANALIGLVENQSDWYLKNRSKTTWPALNSGFNTGVAVMDLTKMRQDGWSGRWISVAKRLLVNITHTSLADQDIVNAVLFFDSSRVHNLPCEWNMQLSDNADYSSCTGNIFLKQRDSAMILHWNKPEKVLFSMQANSLADDQQSRPVPKKGLQPQDLRQEFSNLLLKLNDLDGNLLRKSLNKNQNKKAHLSASEKSPCSNIHQEANIQRRIHPYFFAAVENETFTEGRTPQLDVSIVSQLTVDRLHRLEEIAMHWEGPFSLAIYLADQETATVIEFLQSSTILSQRTNINIHLVFQEGNFYPINSLRNTAIAYATTEFIFIVDFDFVPNPGIYSYLRGILTEMNNHSSAHKSDKTAYIVPAFETFYTKIPFPANKSDLLSRLDAGMVKPFRDDVWQAGHQATNYSRWSSAEAPYEVHWEADFEPYVMIRRQSAEFDPRFVGFGWNKVAFTMLLDALNFKFVVLPKAFIIHLPHPPSMEANRFRNSHFFRKCLEHFKVDFIKELASKFGVKCLKYLQFRQRNNGR